METGLEFSVAQRLRLSAMGLIPCQIDALEAQALRGIALHARSPRLAEARKVLERLDRDASRLLAGLMAIQPMAVPRELDTARLLLIMAHDDQATARSSSALTPDSFLAQLQTFAATTERALAKAREIKERDHSASPAPITLIVRLLEEALPTAKLWPVLITREWLLELSGICYEAAGRKNIDPERAVRAYFRQQADQRKHLITTLNLEMPESLTRARRASKKAASSDKRK